MKISETLAFNTIEEFGKYLSFKASVHDSRATCSRRIGKPRNADENALISTTYREIAFELNEILEGIKESEESEEEESQ